MKNNFDLICMCESIFHRFRTADTMSEGRYTMHDKYDYDDMIYDVLADDHFHDTKNITVTISISNN